MLISDWSSDVCSSDLEEFGLEADFRRVALFRAEGRSGRFRDGAGGGVHREVGRCQSRRPAAALISRGIGGIDHHAALEMIFRAEPVRQIVERQAVLARRIEQIEVGRHGKDGRSEEHTSELQSQMRISYAVFWLKKKKNTEKN